MLVTFFFSSIYQEKQDFPDDAVVNNPPGNAGDTGNVGLIPGSGRSPGGGKGTSLKYSCLGNPWTEEPGGLHFMGSQRVGYD